MSIVDDYGRFEADPALLRVRCYPRQLDSKSTAFVAHLLEEVSQEIDDQPALVRVYQVGSKSYLEITNFGQRCRAKSSRYPAPPAVNQPAAVVPAVVRPEPTNPAAWPPWEQFMSLYPKHRLDEDLACQMWISRAADDERILSGLRAWLKSKQWQDPQYVPNASKFISDGKYKMAPEPEEQKSSQSTGKLFTIPNK